MISSDDINPVLVNDELGNKVIGSGIPSGGQSGRRVHRRDVRAWLATDVAKISADVNRVVRRGQRADPNIGVGIPVLDRSGPLIKRREEPPGPSPNSFELPAYKQGVAEKCQGG